MQGLIEARRATDATALLAVTTTTLAATLKKLGSRAEAWAQAQDFRGDAGSLCLVPDASGSLKAVLAGVTRADDLYALATLPQRLPPGDYTLSAGGIALDAECAALGWALGSYQFTRYKKPKRKPSTPASASGLTPRRCGWPG